MAVFDLGRDLRLVREVPAGLERTFRLARELVQSYEGMGYRVAFLEEHSPERLAAEVTDAQGTKLAARVRLAGLGRGSRLEIELTGRIAVGGMAGMFASEGKVRSVARERLEGLLQRVFGGLSPDPVPAPGHQAETVAAPAKPPPGAAAPPPTAPAPARAHVTPPGAAATTVTVPGAAPAQAPRSLEERLGTLKTMHERGLISDEDYRRKKEQLLASL